ncbi:Ribosomal protein S18 [Dillenia turbinata]|uniref:Small ribosomal subunit protein bS18c n=1 Tax=Dillenia turbinata TaxID=194707 RepID=A0AAN8UWR4_9MAGN
MLIFSCAHVICCIPSLILLIWASAKGLGTGLAGKINGADLGSQYFSGFICHRLGICRSWVNDLDLTKPGVRKSYKRAEFSTTTEEVLRKADFRNVRFLAKFLTEAGIIIKRSQTGISAKAQRKVAREIKTARAFGLLPFTTMGTKAFVFGRTMENLEEDYEYTTYDNSSTAPDAEGDLE